MSNKRAKEKLIQLYGEECFIDKLHLRKDGVRHYKSKGQMKKMKQLTYHHILEKSKGGRATIENGALLSVENHEWFNKQSIEKQAEMNRKFKEYKECRVVYLDKLDVEFKIKTTIFTTEDLIKEKVDFNRARIKAETRKLAEDYLGVDR